MWTSDGSAVIRLGASFDISFCTDTLIPRRSTPSSCALIPIVVVMQVARAVATRSVGENASPLPLLSVGASVEILDLDGPCVALQRKSPLYVTSTLTISNCATHYASCHVLSAYCGRITWLIRNSQCMKKQVTGKDLSREAPRSPH